MRTQSTSNLTIEKLIMSRFSTMSFFATIVLLVNLVLVSSAPRTLDVAELGEKNILLTEENLVSPDEMSKYVRATAFIGDLTIGQRRTNEKIYRDSFRIVNPYSDVLTSPFSYSVDNGIIHYVSILNEPGSFAAVCDLPYSLGTSKSYFNARVVPKSTSIITIFVAAH